MTIYLNTYRNLYIAGERLKEDSEEVKLSQIHSKSSNFNNMLRHIYNIRHG